MSRPSSSRMRHGITPYLDGQWPAKRLWRTVQPLKKINAGADSREQTCIVTRCGRKNNLQARKDVPPGVLRPTLMTSELRPRFSRLQGVHSLHGHRLVVAQGVADVDGNVMAFISPGVACRSRSCVLGWPGDAADGPSGLEFPPVDGPRTVMDMATRMWW